MINEWRVRIINTPTELLLKTFDHAQTKTKTFNGFQTEHEALEFADRRRAEREHLGWIKTVVVEVVS